jgi:hypothetical protein
VSPPSHNALAVLDAVLEAILEQIDNSVASRWLEACTGEGLLRN